MMEWQDQGVVLSLQPHGESSAIVEIFTRDHGRHAGLVRGGQSRRIAPVLQPGNQVHAVWRARLEDQLGQLTVEPLQSRAHLMEDGTALAALTTICALLRIGLPERSPHPGFWAETVALFDRLATPGWPEAYLRWELRLLDETGFGLDLTRCAVTGATQGLAFVSPRTGRAVTWDGAGPWADKLLPLPPGLADGRAMVQAEILQGLALTGHFLTRALDETRPVAHPPAMGTGHVLPRPPHLPEARTRLIDRLSRPGG